MTQSTEQKIEDRATSSSASEVVVESNDATAESVQKTVPAGTATTSEKEKVVETEGSVAKATAKSISSSSSSDDSVAKGSPNPSEDHTSSSKETADIEKQPAAAADDVAHELVGDQAIEIDPLEAARVRRKIDRHILPAMILGHGLVYYDKSVLGNAVLFGMPEDLDLFVYDFSSIPITVNTKRLSWAVSMFFFGMMLGIYPMTFALQRFSLNKTLGSIVFIWALVCGLTAAVTNYKGLWADRFFLGFVESVIPTGFMMIVSAFYDQREQALRQGIWYSSTGLFTIIGAAISYGFAQIEGGSLHGWQYVYIMAGCLTFLFGLWCWIAPASPVHARFLTKEEKVVAVERLRHGQTGIRTSKLKVSQIKESFLDIKTWLIFVMMASSYTINGVLVGFGPLLVEIIGYTQLDAILFQFPLGFIAFVFILLTGWAGSRFHNIRVWMMSASACMVIAGACMIWKSTWSDKAVVPVVGFCLLGFFGPTVALVLTMGMTNVAGNTKKSFMAASIYMAYCLGNIIGPQLVDTTTIGDHYPVLFKAIIICYVITIVLGFVFTWLCHRENARRDALQLDESERGRMAFLDLTDKENMFFRYSL